MSVFVINKSLLRELEWQRRVNSDQRLEIYLKKKTLSELSSLYDQIVKNLNKKYSFIKVRTRFEIQFDYLFKEVSRVKFQYGFWIGNSCVDVYLPRYNLIIEIDGGIHNRHIKMLKDEFRDDFFSLLKLKVNHVENRNVRRHVNELEIGLRTGEVKQVDSRSLDRKMRQIYIETIISHKYLIRTELWN